jgi:hypothetical protein
MHFLFQSKEGRVAFDATLIVPFVAQRSRAPRHQPNKWNAPKAVAFAVLSFRKLHSTAKAVDALGLIVRS